MNNLHNFKCVYENDYLIYSKNRLKPQSYSNMVYNFNANILPYFSDYNIEDISSLDILKWQDFILKKNYSNSHNKNLFGMVKTYFKFCHSHYNLDIKFLDEVFQFRSKIEKKKIDYYTLEEFNQFIKYIDNNIYKQFFNLMFFTGTRLGEAMALKFSDIDFNNGIISITKTIDEHGKREIGTPKTLSSIRDITLDNKLIKDLLELKEYYINLYNDKNTDYFVFGGIKPISSTTANRYKTKACKKANLRKITLHQFRHSHATLLWQSNIDIHTISKRLGHSKTSTTLNIYTHANSEQEKRVLDTLNSARYNFLARFFQKPIKVISTLLKHIIKVF